MARAAAAGNGPITSGTGGNGTGEIARPRETRPPETLGERLRPYRAVLASRARSQRA